MSEKIKLKRKRYLDRVWIHEFLSQFVNIYRPRCTEHNHLTNYNTEEETFIRHDMMRWLGKNGILPLTFVRFAQNKPDWFLETHIKHSICFIQYLQHRSFCYCLIHATYMMILRGYKKSNSMIKKRWCYVAYHKGNI